MDTNTIILWVEHDSSRQQLRQWLPQQYEVTSDLDPTSETHLIILDRPGLFNREGKVIARKSAEQPAFLPVLLLVPETRIDRLEPAAWETVDDIIRAPIRKEEFQARIRVMLTARRHSVESRDRYHKLCEQSPDGIFIVQHENVCFANAAFARITGQEGGEMDQAGLEALFEPGGRNKVHEMLEYPGLADAECEIVKLCPGSPARWVELQISPITYWGESAVMGRLRDVTDRKQQETALRNTKDEAQEMNRLKSALLQNMSHEIRTPLTAVIGHADLLEQQGPERLKKQTRQIRYSAQRLLRTLNSVLELSQLESGATDLTIEEIDLAEELQAIVSDIRPRARSKDLTVSIDVPDTPLLVQTDGGALTRILANLADNAVKFTEEGSIRFAARMTGETAVVEVEDTGIGMSNAFQETLYEAFEQESSGLNRTHEGVGLGLSITKKLVNLIDGSISVESEPGSGTQFTVTFPRTLPTNTPSARKSADPPEWGLDHLPDHQRTLVVEDDPVTRDLIVRMLPDEHEVVTVADGSSALEEAQNTFYNLILLDINLGGPMDGTDVHRRLREIDGHDQALIIAVTAYAMPGDEEDFYEEGFDGYIAKPFTRSALNKHLVQAAT